MKLQVFKHAVIRPTTWSEARSLFLEKRGWIFRGQRETSWHLETTIQRVVGTKDGVGPEVALLLEFQRRAHHYISVCDLPGQDDILEWLALMQHHGCPTRLLDFTRSPFVAAYFALIDATGDSAVWAINPAWLMEQAYETVSVKAAGVDVGTTMDWQQFKRLFFERIDPFVLAIEPFHTNERLSVQQGLFLMAGLPYVSLEDNFMRAKYTDIETNVQRIDLVASYRKEALLELDLMNINAASLFPGLDGFAASLRQWIDFLPDYLKRRECISMGLPRSDRPMNELSSPTTK